MLYIFLEFLFLSVQGGVEDGGWKGQKATMDEGKGGSRAMKEIESEREESMCMKKDTIGSDHSPSFYAAFVSRMT
jgi:hypothetical protein